MRKIKDYQLEVKKMNKFQIKSLTVKDFKGVTTQEFYEFGNEVVIQGDNFTGKTTIAEAILFALYGVDLQGSSRTDALVNKDLKRGKCEVSVVLETDKGEFKISRSATKTKKFIKLDKTEVTQKEVLEIVGEMDLFIVSYLPTHVLGFKDKEAREYFMKFVGEVDPVEVLNELGAFSEPLVGLDLTNIEELKKNLREDSKGFERDLDYIDGRMVSVNDVLKQMLNDPVDVTDLEKEIQLLDNKLYEPGKAPELKSTDEIKEAIKNQYENMMDIAIEKPVFEVVKNSPEEINTKLMNLKEPKPANHHNLEAIEFERKQLRGEYESFKSQQEELSKSETCPTCNQEIMDNEARERIEFQKLEIDKKIKFLIKRGEELKKLFDKYTKENEEESRQYNKYLTPYQIEKMNLTNQYEEAKKEVAEVNAKNKALSEKYEADLSKARQEAKTKYDQLQSRLEEIEKENAAITAKKREEENNYRNAIKQELSALRGQLSKANEKNQEIKMLANEIEKAKKEKLELQQNIRNANETIDKNKAALDAINEYVGEYAKMQSGQINKHFNKVSIQLSDVVKTTGEMKPKFKLLYDEKPIEVLSLSERIRLGLEVSNFIKKVTNTAYPTFIDNAESITDFDKIPGQIFTATVVKGSELIVN